MTYSQALADGSPVVSLIQDFRESIKDSTDNINNAIYIVYLSGYNFSDGPIGTGGIDIVDFRSGTDYTIYGQVAMTDGAYNLYTFAHEAGHVLFNQYDPATNSFEAIDPSGPYIDPQTGKEDPYHNNDSNNIMWPIAASINGPTPIITPQQCEKARLSRIVEQN